MKTLNIAALGPVVRKPFGIIIGSGGSISPTFWGEMNAALAAELNQPPRHDFFSTVDAIAADKAALGKARTFVQGHIRKQLPSAIVTQLAEAKLTGVLSLTYDSLLENKLQERGDSRGHPADLRPFVVDPLDAALVPRTLPIFKMLGSANRDDFALTRGELTRRKLQWPKAVRTFLDGVKNGAILCVGISEVDTFALEILAALANLPTFSSKSLLMLGNEPIAHSPNLGDVLPGEPLLIQGSVGELVRAAQEPLGKRLSGVYDQLIETDPLRTLGEFADAVLLVNAYLKPTVPPKETRRLLDMLFSPDIPYWDPFAYSLDLPRAIAKDVLSSLKELAEAKEITPGCVVVTGAAASGKSVLLKRLAFNLAKDGEIVFWLKPFYYPDGRGLLFRMMKALAALPKDHRRVFFVADDPLTLAGFSLGDIRIAGESNGVEVVVLAACRNSDWESRNRGDLLGGLPVLADHKLADDLAEDEWTALPEYLVSIGAAKTNDDAKKTAEKSKTRSSRDTLASLYFCIPDVRSTITGAVRDELFRLGDSAWLSSIVLGGVAHTTGDLQRAYKAVAVSDHFRTPLPIEVLVSVLKTSYTAWLEKHPPGADSYGLFYSDPEPKIEGTVCYRPRNYVVTQIVVDAVNSGSVRHVGELRMLEEMIAACDGTSHVYHQYVLSILLSLKELDWVEFEDGMRLFETAERALAIPDKTIMHHKANWVRKRGKQSMKSIEMLNVALVTPDYPYSGKAEADEHIHTSIAAAALEAMNDGELTFDKGKQLVLNNLSKARSATFFNPNALHVQANLMGKLVEKLPHDALVDRLALVADTLADLDRGLILLQSQAKERTQDAQDVAYLTDAHARLLERSVDTLTMESEAERLWKERGSQDGFIVASRRRLSLSKRSTKGTDFKEAYDYCRAKIDLITAAGRVPAPGLYEVALHIYYIWRLQSGAQMGRDVDWILLETYSDKALTASRNRHDALYTYINGLALAHLSKWSEAAAQFSSLRQRAIPGYALWRERDFLLDTSGNPRTIQGKIGKGGERSFLYSDQIAADIYLDKKYKWPAQGLAVMAKVRFAFAGPMAVPA